MKYFIPAWYAQNQWWQDRARPYYDDVHTKTEFDDMVSIMGMHYKNDNPFKMIILNHFTDLRSFLYRNQLFECDYWSVFDEIQGFKNMTPQAIDYRDLDWPEHTEFVYTPYLIRCITSNDTYSHIHYSNMGYLIWIEDFKDDIKTHRYVFDDRGMLSSVEVYDDGELAYSQLMSVKGDVVLTEYTAGEVMIASAYQSQFKQTSYSSMMELIEERLQLYLENVSQEPIIAAAHYHHNKLINRVVIEKNLTYCIFTKRNRIIQQDELIEMQHASHWVVDTQDNEAILATVKPEGMLRITPFNTQALPSLSSQLYETYIGVNIDGLDAERLNSLIDLLIDFVVENEQMKIVLMTRESLSNYHYLTEKVEAINDRFIAEADTLGLFNEEDTEKAKVIQLVSLPFENDVIKKIAELRIVIDLNQEPDLFLQICAISAGIPQINMRATDYVEDNINGMIIHDDDGITLALNYYLLVLKHWNASLAYNMKLTKKYASINIINQFDRFIKGEAYEKEI
ncbi:accessory Sec system protein Asp1 [Macrococcoides goetzii]|uniref:accessory Sec system protein Asp1 n=1 Tax=Macrococcus sp. PK TaxID=2801919 RepID=UPI001F0F4295|nr:accessory Sec system protein Asp1 [Macrococcus sp. PK]MCH4985897.1 accessory Sec system protein Asp1 [Macrococcus sp. PK]MCH4986296.1 accessory Sec system protein Asp1 [Macrococcus sp. PK]